ncbi:copper resistance protein CopC [Nonomuraea sp. 3N208]|uniref:copper resistance protein CopC n=1 Tax=Nonomuraea sp. 3N208 TaxID=3457421 RepID=UPI003FCEAFF5
MAWRVVSSDGHPIEGEIPFTVTAPPAAPTPTASLLIIGCRQHERFSADDAPDVRKPMTASVTSATERRLRLSVIVNDANQTGDIPTSPSSPCRFSRQLPRCRSWPGRSTARYGLPIGCRPYRDPAMRRSAWRRCPPAAVMPGGPHSPRGGSPAGP